MAQRRARHLPVQAALGERIEAARHELDLTQRELAARIGVPLGILASWEADRAAPGERLQQLADALGKPVEWLLGGWSLPPWPPLEREALNGETAEAEAAPEAAERLDAERAELETLRRDLEFARSELEVALRELESGRRELEWGREALQACRQGVEAGGVPAPAAGAQPGPRDAAEIAELRRRLADAEARAQASATQREQYEQEFASRRAQLEEEFVSLSQRQAAGLAARKQELLRRERQLAAWQSKLEQAGMPVAAPAPEPGPAAS